MSNSAAQNAAKNSKESGLARSMVIDYTEPRRSARIQNSGEKPRWNCCPDHHSDIKKGRKHHHQNSNGSPSVKTVTKKGQKGETLNKSSSSSPKGSATRLVKSPRGRKSVSKKNQVDLKPKLDECNILDETPPGEGYEETVVTEAVIEETVVVENFIDESVVNLVDSETMSIPDVGFDDKCYHGVTKGDEISQDIKVFNKEHPLTVSHKTCANEMNKNPDSEVDSMKLKDDVKTIPSGNGLDESLNSHIKQCNAFSDVNKSNINSVHYTHELIPDHQLLEDGGNEIIVSDINAHVHEEVCAGDSDDYYEAPIDYSSSVVVDSESSEALFKNQDSPRDHVSFSEQTVVESDDDEPSEITNPLKTLGSNSCSISGSDRSNEKADGQSIKLGPINPEFTVEKIYISPDNLADASSEKNYVHSSDRIPEPTSITHSDRKKIELCEFKYQSKDLEMNSDMTQKSKRRYDNPVHSRKACLPDKRSKDSYELIHKQLGDVLSCDAKMLGIDVKSKLRKKYVEKVECSSSDSWSNDGERKNYFSNAFDIVRESKKDVNNFDEAKSIGKSSGFTSCTEVEPKLDDPDAVKFDSVDDEENIYDEMEKISTAKEITNVDKIEQDFYDELECREDSRENIDQINVVNEVINHDGIVSTTSAVKAQNQINDRDPISHDNKLHPVLQLAHQEKGDNVNTHGQVKEDLDIYANIDHDKLETESYLMQSKPEKVKSRWRRSIEMEMLSSQHKDKSTQNLLEEYSHLETIKSTKASEVAGKKIFNENLSLEKTREIYENFEIIEENITIGGKKRLKHIKESRRMVCDCTLSKAEINGGMRGCGEDCLNRLLLIECGSRCPCGSYCSNKRFQNHEFYPCGLFQTEKKGLGLKAFSDIPSGAFIMEYVGEIVEPREFQKRTKAVAKSKQKHFYFMALTADKVIDATFRGNISRYINHSCDPNAETQKWTVNGELRIGFFSIKKISAGEEITFNYQYQRYGKEAQKCFCESENCCGWIGGNPEEEECRRRKDKKARDDKKRREERKQEMREDMDRDMEIEKLCSLGLKNREHTLTLSRLMVRAEDSNSRLTLLRLLQSADLPCRRLFLDYHGLKLVWSWMVDMAGTEDNNAVKKEILMTLAELPIPHKTMLVESKILSVVERWSGDLKSLDSSLNSEVKNEGCNEDGADLHASGSGSGEDEESSESGILKDKIIKQLNKNSGDQGPKDGDPGRSSIPGDSEVISTIGEEVASLSAKLLDSWSSLKELFKIPKMKERLESRKEHEREADNVCSVMKDRPKDNIKDVRDRVREHGRRYIRPIQRIETDRFKRSNDRKFIRNRCFDKLSKEERRHLFECKVAKEEKERRFKVWGQPKDGQTGVESETFDENSYYYMSWPQCNDSSSMTPEAKPGLSTTSSNLIVIEPTNQNIPPNDLPSLPVPQQHDPAPTSGNYCVQNAQWPYQSPQVSVTPPSDVQAYSYQSTPQQSTSYPYFSDLYGTTPCSDKNQSASNSSLPPCKLPPKWRMHQDSRGYLYYYHKKHRIPQWEPPSWEEEIEEEIEVTDDSSDSESFSSEDSDSDDSVNQGKPRRPVGVIRKDKLVEEHIISPRMSDVESNDTEPDTDQEINQIHHEETVSPSKPPSPPKSEVVESKDVTNKPPVVKRKGTEKHKIHVEIKKSKPEEVVEAVGLEDNVATIVTPAITVPIPESAPVSDIINPSQTIAESSLPTTPDKALDTSISINKYDKKLAGKSKRSQGDLKKKKDKFRVKISSIIVQTLNPYRKPTCRRARITNTDDFKHLARKLTHFVLLKELKHCKHIDELTVTDSVKHKAKDFVKKYMLKFSDVYISSPKRTE